MTKLQEPLAWDGRPEFWVRCRCKARFRSQARILVDKHGPVMITRQPCPECGSTETAMEISTEEHKG